MNIYKPTDENMEVKVQFIVFFFLLTAHKMQINL